MGKRNCLWHICNCTGKDDSSPVQAFARWAMGFGILGSFFLIFGAFAIKVSFDSTAATNGNWWEAAIVLMVGGSLMGLAALLSVFLACCVYCGSKDKGEKDDQSVQGISVSADMRSSTA